MLKKLFSLICTASVTAALLLSLCSCREYSDCGIDALGDAVSELFGEGYLLDNNSFESDEYEMENIAEYRIYVREGSNIVSDKVGIFRAESESAAKEALTVIRGYISNLKDDDNVEWIGSYDMESASKLTGADSARIGCYVFFVVDEKADTERYLAKVKQLLNS